MRAVLVEHARAVALRPSGLDDAQAPRLDPAAHGERTQARPAPLRRARRLRRHGLRRARQGAQHARHRRRPRRRALVEPRQHGRRAAARLLRQTPRRPRRAPLRVLERRRAARRVRPLQVPRVLSRQAPRGLLVRLFFCGGRRDDDRGLVSRGVVAVVAGRTTTQAARRGPLVLRRPPQHGVRHASRDAPHRRVQRGLVRRRPRLVDRRGRHRPPLRAPVAPRRGRPRRHRPDARAAGGGRAARTRRAACDATAAAAAGRAPPGGLVVIVGIGRRRGADHPHVGLRRDGLDGRTVDLHDQARRPLGAPRDAAPADLRLLGLARRAPRAVARGPHVDPRHLPLAALAALRPRGRRRHGQGEPAVVAAVRRRAVADGDVSAARHPRAPAALAGRRLRALHRHRRVVSARPDARRFWDRAAALLHRRHRGGPRRRPAHPRLGQRGRHAPQPPLAPPLVRRLPRLRLRAPQRRPRPPLRTVRARRPGRVQRLLRGPVRRRLVAGVQLEAVLAAARGGAHRLGRPAAASTRRIINRCARERRRRPRPLPRAQAVALPRLLPRRPHGVLGLPGPLRQVRAPRPRLPALAPRLRRRPRRRTQRDDRRRRRHHLIAERRRRRRRDRGPAAATELGRRATRGHWVVVGLGARAIVLQPGRLLRSTTRKLAAGACRVAIAVHGIGVCVTVLLFTTLTTW
mmetsp:Transcript_19822/g.78979  ORF Transcript_19822/g.78979 Transcript_19822/m.78979 type:complete len:689 (+) Transcript_19822:1138-3204(+)